MNTETLQLQRMAYERLEQGTWCNGSRGIPITEPDEMVDMLHSRDGVEVTWQTSLSSLMVPLLTPEEHFRTRGSEVLC